MRMSPRIRVRRAGEKDIGALADLYLENHTFQRRGFPDRLDITSEAWNASGLANAIRELLSRQNVAIFVAEADEEVVGFVDVVLRQETETEGRVTRNYGEVQNLVVVEGGRRRGFGTALMDGAEVWARDQGACEIELHAWEFADGPLGFYERRGYTTIQRTLIRRLDQC